jgi:hypothetical protein
VQPHRLRGRSTDPAFEWVTWPAPARTDAAGGCRQVWRSPFYPAESGCIPQRCDGSSAADRPWSSAPSPSPSDLPYGFKSVPNPLRRAVPKGADALVRQSAPAQPSIAWAVPMVPARASTPNVRGANATSAVADWVRPQQSGASQRTHMPDLRQMRGIGAPPHVPGTCGATPLSDRGLGSPAAAVSVTHVKPLWPSLPALCLPASLFGEDKPCVRCEPCRLRPPPASSESLASLGH